MAEADEETAAEGGSARDIASGQPAEAACTHRDSTARQEAERRLLESEARFRAVFEQAAVGVAVIDSLTGRFLSVNQRTCEIARLSREHMMATTFMAITHPDDLQADLDNMQKLKEGVLRTFSMEKRYLHPDGQITWINLTVSPMWQPGEAVTNHIAVVEDITERKRAEHSLHEAAQKRRLHFEQTPMAVIEWDLQFRVTQWNPAAATIFGFSSEEALGRHAAFIVPESLRDQVDGVWQALLKQSGGERSTNENVRKDGRPIQCEWYNTPLIDECGVATGAASLVQDITERRRAEAAVRESNDLFALFMRYSPIYTFIKVVSPTESRVLQASDNYQDMIGLSGRDMVGKTMQELFPADLAAQFTADDWTVVSNGKVLKRDEDFKGRHYTSIKFPIVQGGKTLLAGYTIDITERKQAQVEHEHFLRKMQEAQKLESLGVLAGGIAHDFNNLLTGIMGYTNMASAELPGSSPVHAHLEPITKAALRAAHLCKQMLAYSGKGRFVIQRIDIGQLVEETAKMLQLSISKKAVLQFHLEKGLPPVEVDVAQVHQVIMNLVINASEAIGERNGVIRVSTGLLHVEPDYFHGALLAPDLPGGSYVFLEVADDGCGMSRETQARIFDPFFTTKFTGRGLGLAAVLGIVRGHKGALKIESELGRGSTFRVHFPAATGAPAGSTAPVSPPAAAAKWKGSGTVLVVDDEETVRSTLSTLLKFTGLDPVLVSDGQEAVEVFRADPGRFRLVLLDLTMPRMDGQQAFVELRQIRPGLSVILMSGFSEKEALARFSGKGPERFLQKPFGLDSLREVLRSVLG